MNILVVNCGSSSLKFSLCAVDPGQDSPQAVRFLARGVVRGIAAAGGPNDGPPAALEFHAQDGSTLQRRERVVDYEQAVRTALEWLSTTGTPGTKASAGTAPDGVGHRVVHGGGHFLQPARIDETVLQALHALEALAPLHNGPSLAGIKATARVLGEGVPMVAVFDTAFHRTLPEHARLYAIPQELSERHDIQRFGFHGTSCRSVLHPYGAMTGTPPEQANLIVLHLGSGCSATAIQGGRSVDTSMGFTPLEGLMMGTRSGDLDPALIPYLARKEHLAAEDVERLLNEHSGLLGVSTLSPHLDVLLEHEATHPRARLAVDMFCHRVRKYVGAYLAVLDGAQAVVFTGGIGEHLPGIRARVCASLGWAGLRLDDAQNRAAGDGPRCISPADAALKAYVIPSDEERIIAWDTARSL